MIDTTSEAATGGYPDAVLQALFTPPAVTLVGASPKSHVTEVLLRHFQREDCAFHGTVNVVHPSRAEVLGHRAYRSMADVDGPLGLVYVLVGSARCLGIIEEIRDQGLADRVAGIVVYAAGFAEVGQSAAQAELASVARAMGVPLLGPQATGLISASVRLLGITDPVPERFVAGRVGFVAQSTGLLGGASSWLFRRGIGLDVGVGFGNGAALDYADLTVTLLGREETEVVCVYVDALADVSGVMSVGRAAAEVGKPVVLFKGAQGSAAQRAARSHTGTLATGERILRGVAQQCGVVLADNFDQLLWGAELFVRGDVRKLRNAHVGVLTNSGGGGIIAAESIERAGLPLLEPTDETRAVVGVARGGSGNPLDIGAISLDAFDDYAKTAEAYVSDPTYGIVTKIGSLGAPSEALAAHRRLTDYFVESAVSAGKLPIVAFPLAEDPRDHGGLVDDRAVVVGGEAELTGKLRLLDAWATGVVRNGADLPFAWTAAQRQGARAGNGEESKDGRGQPAEADHATIAEDEVGRGLLTSAGADVPTTAVVSADDDIPGALSALGWPESAVVAKTAAMMAHRASAGGVVVGLRESAQIHAAVAHLRARFDAPVVLTDQVPYDRAYFVGLQRLAGGHAIMAFGCGVATDDSDVAVRVCPFDGRTAAGLVAYARERLDREPSPRLADMLVRLSVAFAAQPSMAVVDANPIVEGPGGALVALDVKVYVSP